MFFPGGGRPKGSINHATRDLKEFWNRFFTSEEYRESAKQRILNGSASHLESYLLNLIYGKPKESIEIRLGASEEDLSSLSLEELAVRAAEITKELEEAKAVEDAITIKALNSTEENADGGTQKAEDPGGTGRGEAPKEGVSQVGEAVATNDGESAQVIWR